MHFSSFIQALNQYNTTQHKTIQYSTIEYNTILIKYYINIITIQYYINAIQYQYNTIRVHDPCTVGRAGISIDPL